MIKSTFDNSDYLEMIDVRTGDARMTGDGAVFNNRDETIKAFESLRPIAKPASHCFLVDLWLGGNLIDTIEIDEAGFKAITGKVPKAPEYYKKFDERCWLVAQRKRTKAKRAIIPQFIRTLTHIFRRKPSHIQDEGGFGA